MSIDVNAIEQTVVVTAVGDEVNVNIIDQPVLVSVTDQIISVEASGAAGPQGPVGAGVAAGGTTGQVLIKASNTNYDTTWTNAGAGTVYSVNASGSTGISVTGGPITGAGTLTITNTAPDQVVSLTGGGTTTITGTYPNFTISSTDSTVGTVTSVNMTVPTGLTISGNPITSAGTLALALASGYSIPTTASQATWDAAYNDKINSAAVTGTTTKTLTLNQQDGGTITASWTDINTDAVTSVFGRTGAVVATGGDYTTSQVTEVTNLYYTEGRVSANTDVAANTAARHNAVTLGTANGLSLSTQALSLGLASGSTTGALSSTDWTTFNNKQATLSLTTTGSSGAATLVGATLNIPQYSDQFLGTVTSVSFTLGGTGTDLNSSVTSSTTTPSITLNVPTASATNRGALSSADWSTFNGKQVALNGTGFVKISGTTISYDNSTYYLASNPSAFIALTALSAGTGISYNNTTGVITNASPDQVVSITSGSGISVTGTYPSFTVASTITQYTDTLARLAISETVTGLDYNNTTGVFSLASGYVIPTTSSATNWDSAYNDKIVSAAVTGTTTKTLTLTQQDAGTITASWTDDNTDAVTSVFGRTGAVTAQSGDYTTTQVTEGTNLYYTDARARAAVSLTVSGSSGASTYNNSTGVFNIPTYTLSGLGGVPTTRSITINGTAFDLSADRTFNVGTVTSVAATAGTGITISGSPITTSGTLTITNSAPDQVVALTASTGISVSGTYPNFTITNTSPSSGGTVTSVGLSSATSGVTIGSTPITTSGTITLAIATATTSQNGLLSSTDWATFNAKQQALNGTGFVKISGTTISYDNTSYLPLTGGTLSSASSAETLRLVNSGTGYGLYNQSDAYFQGDVKFQSVSNTILKVDSSHKLIAAVAGTDYQAPITNPVTGTGTTNYLPKWTSASAIGNSLVYDDGTNVGIGTTSPAYKLDVNGTANITNSIIGGYRLELPNLFIGYWDTVNNRIEGSNRPMFFTSYGSGNNIYFGFDGSYGTMTLHRATSNIHIGGTTDNGNRLQVTGNGYFSGNVGVGTSSPAAKLHIANSSSAVLISESGSAATIVGTNAAGNTSQELFLRGFPLTFTGNGGGSAVQMTLNPSGNLGLGVQPSAWSSDTVAIQLGGSVFGAVSASLRLLNLANAYNDGANFRYINSGVNALQYRISGGTGAHEWYTAPSGTAGNAITFTQAMTLTSGGNLLVGTTTDSGEKLQVNGSVRFSDQLLISKTTDSGIRIKSGSTALSYIDFDDSDSGTPNGSIAYNNITNAMTFSTGGSNITKLTIASTGAATFSGSVDIGNSVAVSVAAPSTHKVSILIGGVQYYLLASNV